MLPILPDEVSEHKSEHRSCNGDAQGACSSRSQTESSAHIQEKDMTVVIAGAGPIGTALARTYVDRGARVRVLTRSGSGLDHPLVERRRVDVTDAAALAGAVRDAEIIHFCIHASAYDAKVWARELPAAEQVVLAAAEAAGAVVVFPESLYAFDTSGVVTEQTRHDAAGGKPGVRAQLLAARAASLASTVSVVASDYFGPGAGASAHAGDRMLKPATSGGTVRPVGSVDLPHAWTYLPDLAAAMIRAGELARDGSVGSDTALLAPTAPPRTQREVAAAYAAAAGKPAPRVSPVPTWTLRVAGVADRGTRGIVEMIHLFDRPLVVDSSASEALLGLTPTPFEDAVRATVDAFRAAQPADARR
jgi:nucleoside-diphosphate-sugar epimerase